MKAAGLSIVRMGESTWSLWEPEDGHFEYAWMDRVVEAMRRAGINVVMGTPTYSIPTWMYHAHPEILARPLGGAPTFYGMRQNMDIDNPIFRAYAQRLIKTLAGHYRDNQAVIGWQVDNETASYGASNADVFAGFVSHLKEKFGTVENLNKAWLLNYWGEDVNKWEDMPSRDDAQSTGYKLEWLRWQHEYEIAKAMDISATNIYPGTQQHMDGPWQAEAGDYIRSLKHSNYLVAETNAQTTDWDSAFQYPPYDGQLRLDVYTHVSSGANMIEYWHWASLHSGQETYWKGVLSHDLEPNRAYAEVLGTAHELQKIGPHLVNLKIKNQVAILYRSRFRERHRVHAVHEQWRAVV
jgi:beta-galactosidase